MEERILTHQLLQDFCCYLQQEEKSAATMEKYLRDAHAFFAYVGRNAVTKTQVMDYKQHLREVGYAVRSINSMLASLNSLFCFLGWRYKNKSA